MTAPPLTDRESFLAAIAADPDADLPRLAFADYLDEHGTDPTDHARAELIRVQCELATYHCSGTTHTCYDLESGDECLYRCEVLKRQQKRLLAANGAAWRRGPLCEKCGGCGHASRAKSDGWGFPKCPSCHGTGDGGGLLFLRVPENPGDSIYLHPVHFDRGFLTRVTVPTLAELIRTPHYNAGHDTESYGHPEPSPLLRAVVGRVPGSPPERMLVREVVAGDREPRYGTGYCKYFWIYKGDNESDNHPARIPAPLWNSDLLSEPALPKGPNKRQALLFATPAEAVTALARALAQWGRT